MTKEQKAFEKALEQFGKINKKLLEKVSEACDVMIKNQENLLNNFKNYEQISKTKSSKK